MPGCSTILSRRGKSRYRLPPSAIRTSAPPSRRSSSRPFNAIPGYNDGADRKLCSSAVALLTAHLNSPEAATSLSCPATFMRQFCAGHRNALYTTVITTSSGQADEVFYMSSVNCMCKIRLTLSVTILTRPRARWGMHHVHIGYLSCP
jgi:hypothetical protein